MVGNPTDLLLPPTRTREGIVEVMRVPLKPCRPRPLSPPLDAFHDRVASIGGEASAVHPARVRGLVVQRAGGTRAHGCQPVHFPRGTDAPAAPHCRTARVLHSGSQTPLPARRRSLSPVWGESC